MKWAELFLTSGIKHVSSFSSLTQPTGQEREAIVKEIDGVVGFE